MSEEAVDVALIDVLRNDATLMGLAPGGVFRDVAPEAVVTSALQDASQVFGIVTLQSSLDEHAFEGTALEDDVYDVKFVSPSTSPVGAQAALNRAVAILRAFRGAAVVPGFSISCSRRVGRFGYVEADGPVYWQHRGVSWLVVGSPL